MNSLKNAFNAAVVLAFEFVRGEKLETKKTETTVYVPVGKNIFTGTTHSASAKVEKWYEALAVEAGGYALFEMTHTKVHQYANVKPVRSCVRLDGDKHQNIFTRDKAKELLAFLEQELLAQPNAKVKKSGVGHKHYTVK